MPLEDYTTAILVDPENDLTVAANDITVSSVQMNQDTYLYWDKGAAYFDDDFDIDVNGQMDSPTGIASIFALAIMDVIDDFRGMQVSGDNGIGVRMRYDDAVNTYIQLQLEDPATSADFMNGPVLGTQYYFNLQRDHDGGAGGNGRYTLYIRTGSQSGPLQDTLTLDANNQLILRYLYGMSGYNLGGITKMSGSIHNLDLNETSFYTQPPSRRGLLIGVSGPSISEQ